MIVAGGCHFKLNDGGEANEPEKAERQHCHRYVQPLAQRGPDVGICVECLDGCPGGCEMWLASFRGREVIYPGPFGSITAGADKNYPLDYSHLKHPGLRLRREGAAQGREARPDTATFPSVNTEPSTAD